MILRDSESHMRLVLRLSHAQFDGISLGQVMLALSAFDKDQQPPAVCGFANYIERISFRTHDAFSYWRSLLEKSSITTLSRQSTIKTGISDEDSPICLESTVPALASRECDGVTPATIFTAACAIMLARVTGWSDLVFGRLVSGRETLSTDMQDVVGPCINIIPVRAQCAPNQTLDDTLAFFHTQFINGLPFEMIGFDEIVANCTSWPRSTASFGCVTQYQNIDEHPKVEISGSMCQLRVWDRSDQPLSSETIDVVAVPRENELKLQIRASPTYCDRRSVARMLDELCNILITPN